MQHHKSAGFSLPEVILIVAVLAIVAGMAFPDMASFFARQRVEQERTELEQIKRAMEVYARQCGQLPARVGNHVDCRLAPGAGSLTWFAALAGVSNLSANEIQTDTWGVPRRYTHQRQDGVTFMGGSGEMSFNYASVRSLGANRCDDTFKPDDQVGCPANFGFDPNVNDWGTAAAYSTFATRGDDMIVKFTDNQIKAAAYEETLRRLERVIAALDRYAQAKFNEAVVMGNDNCLSVRLFYPRSSAGTSWTPSLDCDGNGSVDINNYAALYAATVTDDVRNVAGTDYLNTDAGESDNRLVGMQALMRLLGLPLDHCCNALTEEPFFYFSTPGVSTGGSCVYAEQPPYFPPKVAVVDDGC